METLRQILSSIAAERSRIVLVTLGVVWGTIGLTVLIAFGTELDASMRVAMRASGRDYVRVGSSATTMPFGGLPAGRFVPLTAEDARAVARAVDGLRSYSVEYTSFGEAIRSGNRQVNGHVMGVDASYAELRNHRPLAGGRFLNERDVAERRRVVFLGNDVSDELFGDAAAVGETVEIRGMPFTVVGVLAPRTALSYYNGRDEEKVSIPSSTFHDLFGHRRISHMILGLENPDSDAAVVDRVYEVLGERHRFDPRDEQALNVANRVAENRLTGNILAGTRIFLAILGVLGMLVAIVGVANVMFVLVEERRAEIGTLVALGATPRHIALGRIGEGLLITAVGGAFGILISALVLWAWNRIPLEDTARAYLGHPEVSWGVGISVAGILGLAGSVAGLFPAQRAARIDPIRALRDE